MKIMEVVGARPNFMKIAPIQKELAKYPDLKPILIHTGQHYDDKMSKIFFEDLELPRPDVYLGVGSDTHAKQTANVMCAFEDSIKEYKPDMILVVGDVNSTLACTLVGSKLQIPVAHVEAGLRSFDRRMPEEINRIVTDNLSDILFITEESAINNLKREGISQEKIYFVGNVMIDSLIFYQKKAKQSQILERLQLVPHRYCVVTLHRPSNVDEKDALSKILKAFDVIEKEIPIIFPVHPRTKKRIAEFGLHTLSESMKNLYLIDPLGYLDFLQLIQNAKIVLTDSGGIQEETTYLGIPCLTLRENTERPITISLGTNQLVKLTTSEIITAFHKVMSLNCKNGNKPPLWDGKAAQRIVKIINSNFG